MKLTKDTKRKPKVSTLIAFGLAGAPQAVDLSGPVDLWTSGPGPILAEKRECRCRPRLRPSPKCRALLVNSARQIFEVDFGMRLRKY